MHGNALPAVSSQNCSRNLITATHRRGDRGRDQVNSACCRSSSRRARCRSACRCDSICALARLSTICRFGWLSFLPEARPAAATASSRNCFCRRQIGQSRHVGLLFSITLASLPDKVEAMKQRRNVRTIRNGERERILIRCREALGKLSGAPVVLAGFGAALNQSRSASGVYTGLICWHGCGCQ